MIQRNYGKQDDEYLNRRRWIWKKMHMSNDEIMRLRFFLQFTNRWDKEFAKLARKHMILDSYIPPHRPNLSQMDWKIL